MQKEGDLGTKGWYRALKVFYIIANIIGLLLVVILAYSLAYTSPFLFLLYGTLIVLILLRLVRSIFLYVYNATPFWKSFLPKAWLITIGVIVLLTILAAVGNMENSSSPSTPSTANSGTNSNSQGYTLQQLQQMGAQPVEPTQNQQPSTSNPTSQYSTYTNVRFSYSICYPTGILIPQGESANGDGQQFLAQNGAAKVLVYGSNAVGETPQQELQLDENYYLNNNSLSTITDQAINQTSFTFSGSSPSVAFYEKTLMQNGQYKTFSIQYNQQAASIFAPIVSEMVQCFANTQ